MSEHAVTSTTLATGNVNASTCRDGNGRWWPAFSEPGGSEQVSIDDTGTNRKEGMRDAEFGRFRETVDLARRLVLDSSPDWFALEEFPGAEAIKRGQHRTTWRVPFEEGFVLAKVWETVGIAGEWKRRLGISAAGREWRAARVARQRGIPTPLCLARGFRRGDHAREVLLFEWIEHVQTLSEAWSEGTRDGPLAHRRSQTRSVIRAVARLLARAHHSGFFHQDGHPGNILLRHISRSPAVEDPCKPNVTSPVGGPNSLKRIGVLGDAEPEALYVDVASARFRSRSPRTSWVVRSLVPLDHYFRRRATATQRLRFLQWYVRLRRELRGASNGGMALDRSKEARIRDRIAARAIVKGIRRHAPRHAARLALRRDRRMRGDGRYFAVLRLAGGWSATVVTHLDARRSPAGRGVPDLSVERWADILERLLIYPSGFSPVRRPGGLLERLTWSLFGSPDRRAFEENHKALHRDVPCEPILAYLERRRAGLVESTALVRSIPEDGMDRRGNEDDEAHGQARLS